MLDGPEQIGRGQRIVDDQRHARLLGHGRDGGNVGDDAAGIGDQLHENRFRLRAEDRAKAFRVCGVGEAHSPAELLEGLGELVDRAAIELARGDELVTQLKQGVENERLRCVTRRHGECRCAAFERRHTLLKNSLGRVRDAGIDVAESLEIEQRRGVLGVLEDIGRGLIDRCGARARGGVRLGARMDCERVEGRLPVGRHCKSPCDDRAAL